VPLLNGLASWPRRFRLPGPVAVSGSGFLCLKSRQLPVAGAASVFLGGWRLQAFVNELY